MADLGAIGYEVATFADAQYTKKVTGTVTENNAPAFRRVRLYDRTLGALIDAGYSSPQGNYDMRAPASVVDPCYVVVLDDEVAPLRNAIIRDRVVPT